MTTRDEFIKSTKNKLYNAGDNEFVALTWLTRDDSVKPPTKKELADLGVDVDE